MAGRIPLVPSRWRHVADHPGQAHGPVPVLPRASGDRAAARTRLRRVRDRPQDRTRPGNNLS